MEETKPETSDNSAVPPLPQAAEPTPPAAVEPAVIINAPIEASESNTQPNVVPEIDNPEDSVSFDDMSLEPPQPSNEPTSKKPKISLKKPNVQVKDPLHVILIVLLTIVAFIALTSYLQANSLNKTKKDLNQKVTTLQKQVDGLEAPTKYVQDQIKTGQIQAVFLASGQVYFGNIIRLDSQTMTLQNVYYLKNGTFNKDGSVTGGTSLVKMGNEVHGPEDKMIIERKNVTFWENLKTGSKVLRAIVQYKATH